MGESLEVKLRTYATLKDKIPNRTYQLEKGSKVDTLFQKLYNEAPELKKEIEGTLEKGNPYAPYIVLKNGRNIIHLEAEETELEDGDEVSIFPPIGGG